MMRDWSERKRKRHLAFAPTDQMIGAVTEAEISQRLSSKMSPLLALMDSAIIITRLFAAK